jgi:hypothetical protein
VNILARSVGRGLWRGKIVLICELADGTQRPLVVWGQKTIHVERKRVRGHRCAGPKAREGYLHPLLFALPASTRTHPASRSSMVRR